MTTRTQRTQGPVAVSLPDAEGRLAINAAETSREIARTSGWPNDKANAARLALAWNCHDDLVAALNMALGYVEEWPALTGHRQHAQQAAIRFIEAALAKAKA